MGLEEILNKIHEETEAQYGKMIADAKGEAQKTIDGAKQKSDSIISQRKAQAEKDVQEERLRSVASARLAAKRQLLQAREEVLGGYENRAMGLVDEFIASKEYSGFLARLIEDGVTKIGGSPLVQVNSRDKKLLGGKHPGYELSEETLECRGGALISSRDGKRRVDNTVESILGERRDELRLKLAEQVFGER